MSRAREIADLVGGTTPDIILKTADGAILNLQTSDTTVTDGSVLGAINFTAPNEGSGTDSLLIGGAIQAVAEGTFAADNNATELVFMTGASEAASSKMVLSSGGNLTIAGTATITGTVLNLPTTNSFITGAGHNIIQVDSTRTYFYGGTNGVQIRTADNASALIEVTNAGILKTNTAGTSNLRLGANAGDAIQSGGNFNTVLGDEAGSGITTGDLHTFIGYAAGDAVTTESGGLTAVGAGALTSNTSGTDNVAIGTDALADCTEGIGNVAVGRFAAADIIDADGNVAIGGHDGTVQPAMRLNTKSHDNTAIGAGALAAHNLTDNSSGSNVAVGYAAGQIVSTGIENTIIGAFAGDAITSGGRNTLIGMNAGGALTGTLNAFLGRSSGSAMTTGDNNVIIGSYNGNQNSLDIRDVDDRAVISDGSGNLKIYSDANSTKFGAAAAFAQAPGIASNYQAFSNLGTSAVTLSGVQGGSNAAAYFFFLSNIDADQCSFLVFLGRENAVTMKWNVVVGANCSINESSEGVFVITGLGDGRTYTLTGSTGNAALTLKANESTSGTTHLSWLSIAGAI